MHEQQLSISKNLSSEVEYSAKHGPEVKHAGFDHRGSSNESTCLSNQEVTAMGKTSSRDQCASSEPVLHDESYGRHGQDMKAAFFLCNPETNQPNFPYAYSDAYHYGGLISAYWPHNLVQTQVMAAASGRVPLPVDIPEDGPIYVNAKQYHGILRRRQTRAKLEAQNKLLKTRKPYLHESRHQHALNRVRGSGGRFLSTKKQQFGGSSLPPTTCQSATQGSFCINHGEHQSEASRYGAAEGARVSGGDGMGVPMQGSSGVVYNGNRRHASIVR